MKVLNEYVIIDPLLNETTSSGIIMNNVKIKNIGSVVAFDPTLKLSIGDKIVYDSSKAISFVHNGKELLACKFSDLICNLN